MALPKEPRQKMINLMYLVLTALLALNVSAEILNAFKTVNNSLLTANSTIDAKNSDLFNSFKQKLSDPTTADRARLWYPKADSARKLADQMITYIDGLKEQITKEAKATPDDPHDDNLEAATHVMADPGNQGNQLRQKLADFKANLLGLHPEIAKEFANILPIDLNPPKTQNAVSKDWGSAYFRMVPTIAALTILSKFQNDVKNSEAMVVDFCHRKVGDVEFVINKYQPLVGQSSNYLMPGQELTVTAGIGAYNSAAQPKVTIDGASVSLNPNGVAETKFAVGATGSYTKMVHISYINQSTGKQESKDFPVTYTVGAPTGASVSADNVKVLYIGLENPLSVKADVGDEKVTVTSNNGTLTKTGAGKYIAKPSTPGKATIDVTAEGKTTPFEFRVKTVPDPLAKVGNSKGGVMRVNAFKAQFGVRAELENFVFEGVKFDVTGYTIVFTGAGFPNLIFKQVQGTGSFDQVRDMIEKAKIGTTVTIDEIKASGPGGTRTLPPIVFNLN